VNNPLTEKWNLAQRPEEDHGSSATFYETGYDNFLFDSVPGKIWIA
jgi:hypothetical protein